jgi:hypothetical protein
MPIVLKRKNINTPSSNPGMVAKQIIMTSTCSLLYLKGIAYFCTPGKPCRLLLGLRTW